MSNHHCLWILAVLLTAASACAQDEDDEQPPGLRARYQVDQSVVERVDPDIAFQWGDGPPDERLPSGSFTANWSGTLLLRSEDKYRFHAFVQGRVHLKVNGQTVVDGKSEQPQWISGAETPLKFGDQPFELSFERTGDAAQLKLYWSCNDFPLEPVPYHVLFQTKASPELSLIERGRVQFEAFRCGNCHSGANREHSERLEAPSLKHVGTGTRRDWLVKKVMQSDATAEPAKPTKMPHFGFTREDAEAIVSTLLAKSAPVELIAVTKLKESEHAKDLQAGGTLIRSVGCLACHTWNSLGEATPFGGGSLDDLATKHSNDWLTTWLSDPGRLNARHRMPIFTLTEKERLQIVLALSVSPKSNPVPPDNKNAASMEKTVQARGAKLIETSRCAQCHDLPGPKTDSPPVMPLTDPKVDWNRGCLQPPDRMKDRPSFPVVDTQALRAYVASWKVDVSKPLIPDPSPANTLAGRRVLERKNCLGCHDRDDVRGISKHAATIARTDETLTGLQMTLIPPRLNAVGDRMHDAGLSEAIRGDQKAPRLNWLRVRMPKFAHSPTDQAALLRHLIGHDRIPDGGPKQESALSETSGHPPDAQRILAGRELLGGKGFSCVACHAVKDYTPKVTALGTRGSNLHLIGQRMRPDHFFRWTRAPLRIMPGVEMPNYQRPHEFILPGQLDQQLIAIWEALNDPNLTAPTNPAVVEQLLAVSDRDQPRVVRDVFTVPGATDETIARAYAVGLPGGHSVLFDLDTCSVRGWTLGDFAKQRCEGKRWYWDLAGTALAARFDKRPDLMLVDEMTGTVIGAETGWDVECKLKHDDRDKESISITYDMTFSKNDTKYCLSDVRDRFSLSRESGFTGWKRTITVNPSGTVWPWFRNAVPEFVHAQSHITADRGKDTPIGGLPKTAMRFPLPEDIGSVVSVTYQTSLSWVNPTSNQTSPLVSRPDSITTVPGFRGQRLPFPRSIMPTAMAWDWDDRLLFTSLKGHLYRVKETVDEPPSLSLIEEGLAAPFGLICFRYRGRRPGRGRDSVVVAHKPELLKLDLDKEGLVECREVVATGWGVTDDYHDWACGIVQDSKGNLIVGLGSDYTFKDRPSTKSRWRGNILRIDYKGNIESIASGLRYPTGLAIDDQDRLFVSDQQGVQNTFNELNYIQAGHRYGVPSRHESKPTAPADPPAVQIPHPWTRSVNGIVYVHVSGDILELAELPRDARPKNDLDLDVYAHRLALAPFSGHFLGCEWNKNMLIRMSVQTVGDTVQGAVYPLSKPAKEGDMSNFVGPLCIGISPMGEIYVGGLQDGGWAGGLNMGDIVKLTPTGDLPNGIREVRVTSRGFDIEFFHKVDSILAAQTTQYKISGYTRVWKGDYATPDSGHHSGDVTAAVISQDGRTVSLTVAGRKPGHVYDVSVDEIGTESKRVLWPAIGHYTLHRIPD